MEIGFISDRPKDMNWPQLYATALPHERLEITILLLRRVQAGRRIALPLLRPPVRFALLATFIMFLILPFMPHQSTSIPLVIVFGYLSGIVIAAGLPRIRRSAYLA